MSGTPFEPGERALLIDDRGRRYLVRLRPGEAWHSHGGAVPHDAILGSVEGARVRSTGGMSFVCFRARLADQFGAVIHIDDTRAVEPLERTPLWESGDVPETYPHAV